MSHYSNNPAKVRVDFFKPSGKWYATESLEWKGYDGLMVTEFKETLKQLNNQYNGLIAVCLEPYNKHTHPIMLHNITGGN